MKAQNVSQQETTEALADFQSYVFSHPAARQAFRDLGAVLGATSSPQIIIFTGPTGVGKSTLAKAACNRLLQYFEARLAAEPDFVPVVTINAVPPNGNGFSWKDFHIRLLSGQSEPLISRKLVVPRQAPLLPRCALEAAISNHSTADALRRSVEGYLRLRKTKFLIVDEAQHLLLVGGKQRLECQFECLKSLTIETGVTILLIGTYSLLDILDQSGQLSRRSQVVNYPRYDMRRGGDRESFRKVLVNFEQKLAANVPTQLDTQADYFYRKSAGCVGILKDWLARCLEYALRENAAIIDAALAERFALKNRGLLTIIEEACLGEAKLADVGDDRLLDLLTHGILFARDGGNSPNKPRRPGKRNPVRDPVGR